jgi:hypothetical protein
MKIPSFILSFLCQHQNIIILEKKAQPSLALSSETIGPVILKQQTCSLKFKGPMMTRYQHIFFLQFCGL